MEKERKVYLMSIRPKYAYRIFAGIKKFELRKWFGLKPEPGSTIIVYASGSVRAIIGEFTVGKVIFGDSNAVWRKLNEFAQTGLGRDDYSYISGSRAAMALEVVNPKLYDYPITLNELRRIFPGFMPPLSFRVLELDEPLYRLLIEKARKSIKSTIS